MPTTYAGNRIDAIPTESEFRLTCNLRMYEPLVLGTMIGNTNVTRDELTALFQNPSNQENWKRLQEIANYVNTTIFPEGVADVE